MVLILVLLILGAVLFGLVMFGVTGRFGSERLIGAGLLCWIVTAIIAQVA